MFIVIYLTQTRFVIGMVLIVCCYGYWHCIFVAICLQINLLCFRLVWFVSVLVPRWTGPYTSECCCQRLACENLPSTSCALLDNLCSTSAVSKQPADIVQCSVVNCGSDRHFLRQPAFTFRQPVLDITVMQAAWRWCSMFGPRWTVPDSSVHCRHGQPAFDFSHSFVYLFSTSPVPNQPKYCAVTNFSVLSLMMPVTVTTCFPWLLARRTCHSQ